MKNQDYVDMVYEHMDGILRIYRRFKDRHPILLYDLQEKRVYAFPYKDFSATLSKRSQEMLDKDYESVISAKETVVFVRDNEREKLVSFKMDLEAAQELEETDG